MDVDIVAHLRKAFPDLEVEALKKLSEVIKVKTYEPETLICKEGAYEHVFYLIVDGEVAITKHFEGDEDRLLRLSAAGEFFGEMALIQNEPRAANVRTSQTTTVLEFERDVFEQLMTSSPNLAWSIVRTTFDRLRSNDQTVLNDLRDAYQTLAQLDKAKLDFIAIAAHELRTPLTVIQGYADVLQNDPKLNADPVLDDVIQGVIRGAKRLHEIVNGMLDITKIDNETLEVSHVPVLLQSILTELKRAFWDVLEKRNIQFYIKQIGDVQYLEGDPSLIYKIFYQLYSNAIKYTPDGGDITTTYWLTEVEGMGETMAIVVQDSGVGIDSKYHSLIFEKFFQIGESKFHSSGKTSFKGGGPGLGLALVKGAVEAHGGMVWVESEGYNEETMPGTTFKVLLPVYALPVLE